MRRSILTVLTFVVATVVIACSSSSSSSASSGTANASSGLTGKTWQLTAITEVTPAFQGVIPAADQANYTITFNPVATFDAKADCNTLSGGYTTTPTGGMTITPGPMTRVACAPGSFSDQYVAGLSNAASYAIANSELTITLKDNGTLVFK